MISPSGETLHPIYSQPNFICMDLVSHMLSGLWAEVAMADSNPVLNHCPMKYMLVIERRKLRLVYCQLVVMFCRHLAMWQHYFTLLQTTIYDFNTLSLLIKPQKFLTIRHSEAQHKKMLARNCFRFCTGIWLIEAEYRIDVSVNEATIASINDLAPVGTKTCIAPMLLTIVIWTI